MSEAPRSSRRRSLARDGRGAATLELLAVLVPVLALALCSLELVRLSIAELMMQRSAGIAVRACAVMKDQPLHCDANEDDKGQSPDQDAQIQHAAAEALKPLPTNALQVSDVSCQTTKDADGHPKDVGGHLHTPLVAQSGQDTLTLQARFHCIVPLASAIVCPDVEGKASAFGAGERTRLLHASASYAHQGARYDCWYSKELQVFLFDSWPAGEVDTGAGDVDPWDW